MENRTDPGNREVALQVLLSIPGEGGHPVARSHTQLTQGPSQPLAAVRADRQARAVQRDPERGCRGGHVRRDRGRGDGPVSHGTAGR